MGPTTLIDPKSNNDISLDDSCESFIGKLLKVKPIYGWGWDGNKEAPFVPKDFKIRLEKLWWHDGKRRGGIGKIETKGHTYDGWTVIFNIRHVGTFNFTDRIGYYNISITKQEIYKKDGWPLPKNRNKGGCGGYCEIKA
jgi:hypothetical protein